jgi:hypothetical protein
MSYWRQREIALAGIADPEVVMCTPQVYAFVLALTVVSPLSAQRWSDGRPLGQRRYTATAGVGNSLGWFGVQGERYFMDERLSIFLGVGYTPSVDAADPYGPTFALGIRSFTRGFKHRLFVEGSASQLVVESGGVGRYYGPGAQAGYQFVSPGGFTLMASLGAGYALGVPRGGNGWASQVGLSLGYTWRRLPDPGGRRQM